MDKKRGVSLIVLVVSIIVLAILVTISVTSGIKGFNKGIKNSFEFELQQLEELCSSASSIGKLEEYISKDFITLTELKSKVPSVTEINNETAKNRETSNSKFYKINIDKIGVNESSRGKGKKGERDYFYLSVATGRVYYLNGVKEKKNIYYSLAGVSGIVKDPVNLVNGQEKLSTEVLEPGKIFTEEVRDNKIYLHLKSKPKNNNLVSLEMKVIYNGTNKEVRKFAHAEVIGETYYITSETAKNAKKIVVEVPLEMFNVVRQEVVNIDKLDVVPPVINNVTIDSKASLKLVNIEATDNKNQIDKYYVLPIEKLDEEGYNEKIFTTNAQDKNVLADEIKVKAIQSTENIIKVDKNITKVYVMVTDKSGLASEVKEITLN